MTKFVYYLTFLISKLHKIIGGGTGFPGRIALKLKPNILSEFVLTPNRIFVSGTNGKTSTATYLKDVFTAADYSVCHNSAGANLKQGIVTTLLNNSNSKLELGADTLVIEIDEKSMPPVFAELDPVNLLLTNLFTDQVDRMGEKWQLAKLLSQKLPHQLNLYVNGDDPALVWLAEQINPKKIVYFGLDQEFNYDELAYQPETCPYCDSVLHYEQRYYDSLGKFNCPCGFKSPELDYIARDIELGKQRFTVRGQVYKMPYEQLYLLYNMLATITIAEENSLPRELVADVLATQDQVDGRFEFIHFNHHKAWLNLAKNPAGINQSLKYIKQQLDLASAKQEKINLMLAFNNSLADGLDYSWLEQANFEILQEDSLAAIYLGGSLQEIVFELLKKNGIAEEKIIMTNKLPQAVYKMKESNLPSYFLANFTMLKPLRNEIFKS